MISTNWKGNAKDNFAISVRLLFPCCKWIPSTRCPAAAFEGNEVVESEQPLLMQAEYPVFDASATGPKPPLHG